MSNRQFIYIALILLPSTFLGCRGFNSGNNLPVLHLFSDAKITAFQGIWEKPKEKESLRSILTYPHEDALWVAPWQGRTALRFESGLAGDLRGSLYLFREIAQKDFQLHLQSWLDCEAPETWSGMVFWMTNQIRSAVGVRWKTLGARHLLQVQIFTYRQPELSPLVARTFPISSSHWASISLSVQNNHLQLGIDALEPIATILNPEWYSGNFFGFFQSQGTGFFADLSVEIDGQTIRYDDVFQKWNQEMVNTTQSMVLTKFAVPEDLASLPIPIRRIEIAKEWRVAVPVVCPSELEFEVKVPRHAALHVGCGILPPFALASATAEFQIAIKTDKDPQIIGKQVFHPASDGLQSFRYHDFHIALDVFSGKTIRLQLQVMRTGGEEPVIGCWSEPILTTRKDSAHPNVLFVLLDTLRADRVGAYGNPKGLTPNIDQLAQSGTLFRNTISQAPWTTPSHASFFTGLYPSEAGCDHAALKGNVLQEGYLTWAELLQKTGYYTAAFTSGIQIRGGLGFNQGFDIYQDVDYDKAISIETVYERFRRCLDVHSEAPWFFFLHTYAVHFPYKHLQYLEYRNLARTWDDQRKLDNDTYDGGVRFVDEYVGLIVRELLQRNQFDSTLLIVASDHGEDLGERGMPRPAQHGHTLYDEQLRVPLILHYPKIIPQGKKVDNQVRLIDLLPTVLELLHIKIPAWCHGLSLTSLWNGNETGERPALSEALTYGVAQVSLRTSGYKLIFAPDLKAVLDPTPNYFPIPAPPPVQLYDLHQDPHEKQNLSLEQTKKVEEMMRVLELIRKSSFSPDFFTGSATRTVPQLSTQLLEELQSMGYIAK